MLPCQGWGGGGSGEGTFLPLNFHLCFSVRHRGHPAVYQPLSWRGSMVLSPSHVKTTSPWASFHTQPSVGPCLPTPCPTWAPMVARLAHAEKSTGFWKNDPLQPTPGWSPPSPCVVSISGFLALRGDFGNSIQVQCQPCRTRGRHMASPCHLFLQSFVNSLPVYCDQQRQATIAR